MNHRRILTRGTAAALCLTVGAGAGIATGVAATTKSTTSATAKAAKQRRGGPGGRPMAVHQESVVLNKAGTAFITQTEDSGTVVSVFGSDVTIKEGTATVTYKTTTIAVPDGATIRRNGKTAALSDLKAGDHVHIEQSSDGTNVFAGDSSFVPPGPRDGHGGPPPAGATGATGASGAASSN